MPEGRKALNALDDLGRTPLHEAAESGHVDCARILLGAGADVNACDARYLGHPPLFDAIRPGNSEMIQLLMDAGATPTLRVGGTQSPLDRARRLIHAPELAEMLEAHLADR